jgi:uncharacterized membrane protein
MMLKISWQNCRASCHTSISSKDFQVGIFFVFCFLLCCFVFCFVFFVLCFVFFCFLFVGFYGCSPGLPRQPSRAGALDGFLAKSGSEAWLPGRSNRLANG